ncbi:MAG: hypothetical protein WDO18_21755 [Acidobacteriota bacterium]
MKKWMLVAAVTGVLMGAGAFWFHSRPYPAPQLVQMLPPDNSVYVYLNVAALRSTGILDLIAGSQQSEEADYRKFVEDTAFDYRKDLDSLAVAFREGDVYYAAQGNFTWAKLEAYAPAHGGKCERFLCTMAGSEPGRNITYYMPRTNVLAIAVSRHATAGDMVAPGSWQSAPHIENVGLWVSAPPPALKDLNGAPGAARPFLEPLRDSTSAIFTLGPGQAKDSFELRLKASARDGASAAKIAKQYADVTDLLSRMLAHEKTPANAADLSSVLTGGRFNTKDNEVTGTWPISKALIESLATSMKPEMKPGKK